MLGGGGGMGGEEGSIAAYFLFHGRMQISTLTACDEHNLGEEYLPSFPPLHTLSHRLPNIGAVLIVSELATHLG